MALENEEDEWDEKIKSSLRYSIRLLIKHPNIDPARITNILRMKPSSFGKAGTPRVTSAGKILPGVHKESGWSSGYCVERNRLFFLDVVKLIDKLKPHKDFCTRSSMVAALSISLFSCPATSILATPFDGAT